MMFSHPFSWIQYSYKLSGKEIVDPEIKAWSSLTLFFLPLVWLDPEKRGWHEGVFHFYCLVYVWFHSAVSLPNRPVKWSGNQNIQKTKQVFGGYQGSHCEVSLSALRFFFFFLPGSCLRLKIRISVYLKNAVLCLSAMRLQESRHSVDPGGNPLMLGFPEMVFFLLPFTI